MAVIVSFDTATLEGLVNTIEKKVNALNASVQRDGIAEHTRISIEAQVALVALRQYITSIT